MSIKNKQVIRSKVFSKNRNVVLIIEDSKAFAISVASVIRSQHPFEVVIAYNFQSAIQVLTERSDDIFVSITDINLPDAEDGAAVRLVRSYDIPCVVFTGNFSNALREDVLAMGVCDYVLKQGAHDLAYVSRLAGRLHQNPDIKILVVEDSVSSKTLIIDLLRRQRYSVVAVGSAEAALQLLEEETDFRIAIIDSILEGMEGVELLKRLRVKFDSTQMGVIGISGRASHEEVAKFIKYGANDFLSKPFEHEEFFCRLNNNVDMLLQFDLQKQLLDQKNQLLGMAAHDIRGPLGNIISGVSLASHKVSDPTTVRILGLVQESTQHMKALLDDLLDISAIEQSSLKLNLQTLDLRNPIKQAVAELQALADEKMQDIVLDVSDSPVMVQADELRIREVVSNILSNAIKFSPKGEAIKLYLKTDNRKVSLAIEDKGPSISTEEQKKLFMPFSKLSNKPTGGESSTGLGLAICKKIIELHSAKISYFAKIEGGSIFEVELPLNVE